LVYPIHHHFDRRLDLRHSDAIHVMDFSFADLGDIASTFLFVGVVFAAIGGEKILRAIWERIRPSIDYEFYDPRKKSRTTVNERART